MGIKSFKDLLVWQKSYQLVLEVYKITRYFPAEERYHMISQLRRCSSSIGANIAEGGKKSTKDFIRFLDIATGSLEETKFYLMLALDLNYLSLDQSQKMDRMCEEIGKMLYGLKSKLRQRL